MNTRDTPVTSLVTTAGTDADELLAGSAGDDTLEGGGGNDTLQGGSGTDMAVFAAPAADYRFGWTSAGALVVERLQADGSIAERDVLESIERLQFGDRSFVLEGAGAQEIPDSPFAYQPSISATAFADGRVLVAWDTLSDDNAPMGRVRARFIGQDGIPIGEPLAPGAVKDAWQSQAAVAVLDDGGFVFCWNVATSTGTRVVAQRYAPDGSEAGPRITIADRSSTPELIAVDGGFVVAWQTSITGSVAMYDNSGSLQSSFRVATTGYVEGLQLAPRAGGGFVATWNRWISDAADRDVYFRGFDADGTPLAEEVRVNARTAGAQTEPLCAVLGNGTTVVGWIDNYAGGLWLRLVGPNGAPLGSEFMADPGNRLNHIDATLAALAGGGFVALWYEGDSGLWAQRYTADGSIDGAALCIDAGSTGLYASDPEVAVLPDGGFAVFFRGGMNRGTLFVRRVDAEGNLDTAEVQGTAADDLIDLSGAGALAAAGGAGNDVYLVNESADRLAESADGGTDTVHSSVSWTLGKGFEHLVLMDGAGAIDGTGNGARNRISGNDAANRIEGGAGDDRLSGGGGIDTVVYAGARAGVTVILDGDRPRATGGAGTDRLKGFENVDGSAFGDRLSGTAGVNALRGAGGDDTLTGGSGNDLLDGGDGLDVAVFGRAAAGYRISTGADGLLVLEDTGASSGSDGIDQMWRIDALQFADRSFGVLRGGEFRAGATGSEEYGTSIAHTGGGGFVVAWATDDFGMFAQRVDTTGAPSGAAQRVGSTASAIQYDAAVASLAGGGFVSAWRDTEGSIHLQRHDRDGAALGDPLLLDAGMPTGDRFYSITGLADGGFLVSWQAASASGVPMDLYVQRFGRAGAPKGEAVRVFDAGDFGTDLGVVTLALDDGGFALMWRDGFYGGSCTLYLQRFAADGTAVAAAGVVGEGRWDSKLAPVAAALDTGDVVVTWVTLNHATSVGEVRARIAAADGSSPGPEILLARCGTDSDVQLSTAALAGGGFVVCWSDFDGEQQQLRAQRFNDAGKPLGDAFTVNTTGMTEYVGWLGHTVSALPDGGFVVGWSYRGDGGVDADVYWQRYDSLGQPSLNGVRGTEQPDTIDLSGSGPAAAAGGAGDDVYFVAAGDRPEERPGEGLDTVHAQVDWTLGAQLEDLVLVAGAGAMDGTGNALANRISGNEAANVLSGAGGDDTLDGGAGNDTASYADARKPVRVDLALGGPQATGGAGTDTLLGIENLVGGRGADLLAGDAAANRLEGGGGGDTLRGGGGDDSLQGGADADQLEGGPGNDFYTVTAGDALLELPSAGQDTVLASVDWTLGANLEVLVLGGDGALAGTGNASANRLVGNTAVNLLFGLAGDDRLEGMAGDDTLSGGSGRDTLAGGAGADWFLFDAPLSASTNVDLIEDYDLLGDMLVLDLDVFSAFRPGTGATGAVITYDIESGLLYYDPDGNGDADPVAFAQIGASTHPDLNGAQILFVD